MSQLAARVLQVSPHKPLEFLQLGRLVDEDVLGDRIKLLDPMIARGNRGPSQCADVLDR